MDSNNRSGGVGLQITRNGLLSHSLDGNRRWRRDVDERTSSGFPIQRAYLDLAAASDQRWICWLPCRRECNHSRHTKADKAFGLRGKTPSERCRSFSRAACFLGSLQTLYVSDLECCAIGTCTELGEYECKDSTRLILDLEKMERRMVSIRDRSDPKVSNQPSQDREGRSRRSGCPRRLGKGLILSKS